jgi:hypothetical protein
MNKLVVSGLAACLVLGANLVRAEDEVKPQGAKPAPPPKMEITVKGANSEAEAKAKLRADALLARCQIKPVMTDEEIEFCKLAYQQTR